MNEYKPASRPAAFGALAVTLAAITIGLAVVLPAKMDSAKESFGATQQSTSPAAVDADAGPLHVEVIARRSSAWATVHNRMPHPDRQASDRPAVRAVASPQHVSRADAGLHRGLILI